MYAVETYARRPFRAYGREFKSGEPIRDYESFEPRVRRALEGSGKVGTRPVEGNPIQAAEARIAELEAELEQARARIAELEALLEKPAERVKPPGPADRAEAAEPSKRRQR